MQYTVLMTSVDNEITRLQEDINNLKISTANKISSLQRQVDRLKTQQEKSTVTPATAEQRHFTGHTDHNGRRIHIGKQFYGDGLTK